jgi:hypothetical protein|tara:strand:+ start:404 stop:1153 length:750 start_codon:yes stop_codon:yes gene_type:complete
MAANPSSSIIFFILFTLGYFITKYYVDTPVIGAIYFLTLIIVQFFINLQLTSDICNESQYGIAMTTTIFPWVFIFGILVILLKIFPNWLSPFSNTFGYLFTYITGVNEFLMEILKSKSTNSNSAIEKIYENKSLLINSITLENISDWWKKMSDKNSGILKSNMGNEQSDNFKKLEKFIRLKTNVAEFIWYILTGILVTSVSYNYILNSGCTQSAEEMEKRHNEYLEQENKLASTKKSQEKNKIIYKTYE